MTVFVIRHTEFGLWVLRGTERRLSDTQGRRQKRAQWLTGNALKENWGRKQGLDIAVALGHWPKRQANMI